MEMMDEQERMASNPERLGRICILIGQVAVESEDMDDEDTAC